MGLSTTSFAVIADTEVEKNNLNTTVPGLVEGTMCYVLDSNKTYKKTSGAWPQYQPDAAMQSQIDGFVASLATKADSSTVSALATTVSNKADSSTVSALSTTVSGKADTTTVNAALATKADSSTVSSISSAVTGLTTTVSGLSTSVTGLTTTVSGLTTTISNLTLDTIPEGTTNKYYTQTEKTKLAGLVNAATPSNNVASRSIVTSTGATGFQVSSTRGANVKYSCSITTTATIGGNQTGTIVLEIAPTNSATAGDWVEAARITNGQAISLAVVLQSVQQTTNVLEAYVPAGYYAKLRSINVSGTPTYSFVSGQETLV